jgi:ERCC4-type nuclease
MQIEEIIKQVDARKGAIKVDANELATHPKLVSRLGEYAEVCHLKSGDFAFNTAWGKVARIEYKLWDNLMADVANKHLNDQLRRQLEDDSISILLIEEFATSTPSGKIRTKHRDYPEPWWWLWNYLTSVQMAGTYLYFSPNELLTSRVIIALFEYFQRDDHKVMGQRQRLISMHPSLTPHQRSFTGIPGVGDEMAKVLDEKYHSSMAELSSASIEDLIRIDHMGKAKATRVWNYLHGTA